MTYKIEMTKKNEKKTMTDKTEMTQKMTTKTKQIQLK